MSGKKSEGQRAGLLFEMESEQVRMRDQAKKVGKKLNYRLVNFELLLKRRCARRFLSARMN